MNRTTTYNNDKGCHCNHFHHPGELNIPAGLDHIPRQIATFPEFRRAMLASILNHPKSMRHWRARKKDDLGIMLLEMWAYICDSLAFYDEVIAQEGYLRTAGLRPSLRKLVAMLGYRPRPAVGSTVSLVAFAEGRKPVTLPKGTAFRSGGFNGEAPQVFELERDTVIHPLANQWDLQAVYQEYPKANNLEFLLIEPRMEIQPEAILFLKNANDIKNSQVVEVADVESVVEIDGKSYSKVSFKNPVTITENTKFSDLRLMKPVNTFGLGKNKKAPGKKDNNQPKNSDVNTLVANPVEEGMSIYIPQMFQIIAPKISEIELQGLNPEIKVGDFVLLSYINENRWFQVNNIEEVLPYSDPDTYTTVNGMKLKIPANFYPVSKLKLDADINSEERLQVGNYLPWFRSYLPNVTLHYGMQPVGRIVSPPKSVFKPASPLILSKPIKPPANDYQPGRYFLEDKNQDAASFQGQLDFENKKLKIDDLDEWKNDLTFPIQAFGNVIEASRGESVLGEILGSGDASVPNQSFTLKKKPLTYLHSSLASTLNVYVDGILWSEVPTFYGTNEDDQVYIVRQNDKEESEVIFGDGKRGSRLPTGNNNVVANYRFGAGAARPPAHSITQISKPAVGLISVKNLEAARGGADAESASILRSAAPGSALLMGRAVSVKDMEVEVLSISGVRAVQASWHWHGTRQQPVVQIWFIGDVSAQTILQKLREVSDPSTPFDVQPALEKPASLSLALAIDPRHLEKNVLPAVYDALMGPDEGFLLPQVQGIGTPLFRSRIFETVLKVSGVTAVEKIGWGSYSFKSFAKDPGIGKYFDFELGGLVLNGTTFGTISPLSTNNKEMPAAIVSHRVNRIKSFG